MSTTRMPADMQDIIDLFSEAPPQDRLSFLLEYAESLPDLPPELEGARDSMEQVHECQSPVFLQSKMEDGQIRYFIDVPRESPTVRGFAGILYQGMDGATPAEIAAIPKDLYHRMKLNDVLSPLRLRGLSALLVYMKRQAARLSHAA